LAERNGGEERAGIGRKKGAVNIIRLVLRGRGEDEKSCFFF
jgi:hypothetical protein